MIAESISSEFGKSLSSTRNCRFAIVDHFPLQCRRISLPASPGSGIMAGMYLKKKFGQVNLILISRAFRIFYRNSKRMALMLLGGLAIYNPGGSSYKSVKLTKLPMVAFTFSGPTMKPRKDH
jgi:hypothetical protein